MKISNSGSDRSLPPVSRWILSSMPGFIRGMGFKFAINTNYTEVTELISAQGTKPVLLNAIKGNRAGDRMVEKSKRLRFYLALLEPVKNQSGALKLAAIDSLDSVTWGGGKMKTQKGKPMLYIIVLLPPAVEHRRNAMFLRTYVSVSIDEPHSVGGIEENVLSDDQYNELITTLQKRFPNAPIQQILTSSQERN